jgi:tetratricopeptide (TPR) repeat protein
MKSYYGKAVPHLSWVQAWDPQKPQNAVNVGLACLYAGGPQKATEWFAKAALIDPKYPDAYYYAGEVADEMGDKAKAREFFQKTLELDPHHPRALQDLQALDRSSP